MVPTAPKGNIMHCSKLFRPLYGPAPWCVIVALIFSILPLRAQTDAETLLRACDAQVTGKFKQWRFAPITADVAAYAKSHNENPTVTSGDFDGDGRKDVALLVQDGPDPDPNFPGRLDSLHIAVCMNTTAGVKLFLIDKPYCGDGIALSQKGQPYYDYATDTRGSYKLDGVSAYCFEKAGATYEFEKGLFRMIVDSD